MDCSCAAKRGPEERIDSVCSCPTKLKLAVEADHGVEAPKKETKRLSQRKIDWILSRRKRRPYCSPNEFPILCNPGPDYSQAEADDFRAMLLGWNESREAEWKIMSEMQQWVRSEYAAKGFVEVDEDHCLFHGRDDDTLSDPEVIYPEEEDDAEEDYPEEDYAEEDYSEEENAEEDYTEQDNAEEVYAEEHHTMI
jgi:hypothetical protein